MSEDASARLVMDQILIQNVIAKGLQARDSARWQELGACYHPDATLTTSWFNGTAGDFVKGSAAMKTERHTGESQKHMTGNYVIRVVGDRALAECDLILYQRRHIDGVDLDFTTWSRRLHLLARRDGTWKIWQQTVIYEKDRMDPAYPNQVPNGFYERIDFSKYPQIIRYHCWANDVAGFPPPKKIVLKGTAQETEARESAERWLSGA